MYRVHAPVPQGKYHNQDNVVRHELLLVHSRDRDMDRDPRPNAYTIRLPKPFRNVIRFTLTSAQLPQSKFNVNTTNNMLDIILNGGTYEVIIPTAFYDGAGLAAALELALNTAIAPLGADFTVTFDANTNKLTMDHANLSWTFLVGSGTHANTTSVRDVGGLGTNDFGNVAATDEVAPFPVDLQAARHVNLVIKYPKSVAGRITALSGSQNIFAKLVIGSVIQDTGPANFGYDRVECLPLEWTGAGADIELLDLEFRDSNGELFDFDFANHCLTFEIVLGPGYHTLPRVRANQGPYG